MYKRILRTISAILVLAMLTEMLPTTLLGNFVQRAMAAETAEILTGYTAEASQETISKSRIAVPPSHVSGTSIDVPAPSYEEISLSQDDEYYISLLESNSVFSQLSDADIVFLSTYTGISSAAFAQSEIDGLTIADTVSVQTEADVQTVSTASVSESSGGTSSSIQEEIISAPYTYRCGEDEQVSLNTGALICENTDYVLPGINGLDLVIGRRYNSMEAALYKPELSTQNCVYYVSYGYDAYLELGSTFIQMSSLSTQDKAGPFPTNADAEAYASTLRTDTELIPDYWGSHALQKRYYAKVTHSASLQSDDPDVLYCYAVPNRGTEDFFGLGLGWSFQFSYISGYGDSACLHLADGRAYSLDGAGSSTLDYPLLDLNLKLRCSEFSNGSESSYYRLTYGDGRREYFNKDGKLIGIQDRYDNTITFVYNSDVNDYPHITITDTLDRVVIISGQESENGHIMTVDLPDGNVLTYEVETLGNMSEALTLTSYTDLSGGKTQYSYTDQNLHFYSGTSAVNKYLNLTTITHPTMSQSVYEYMVDSLSSNHYRVAKRWDCIDGNTVNQTIYGAYRDGIPQVEYSTVTDVYGVTKTFGIQSKKLVSVSISQFSFTLQTTEYTYAHKTSRYQEQNIYPTEEKITTYSAGSTTPLISITASDYDDWGNKTANWTPLANGDTTNTEYKTICTYDNTYNLLLTKTYKADSDTTVELRNTLSTDKKSVIRTEIYVNNVLKSRTDYAYDSYGNVTSEKRYHDDFVTYDLTEYAYQGNAYLSQEKHSGILTADGSSAVSTPGQPAGTIATSYVYDTLGRLTSMTDGSGSTTSYTYDALGNVTQVTNPDNTTVSYARNYTSNTLTVTDENGARVKYTYTPLGLEFETIDIQTGNVITQKEYDSMSRLSQITDFVYGAVTTYAYDALDRVTAETVRQGDIILAQTLYDYDDAAESGLYQKVTKTVVGDDNAPSIITTQYTDKCGNVIKTGKFLNGVEYFDTATYDYVGNAVTQLTAADAAKGLAFTAKYEYNGLGQVVKTYNAESQYTTNTYNALGQLVETTDYAGTPTTYSYDALGRLLTQTITIETGKTATSKYDYDASGNIIREYSPTNAVGSTETWSKTEYSYDSRQNLVSVQQYDGNQAASQTSYTYDNVGNLLSMTAGGNTTSYTYDRFGNTLTMTDALGQMETYTYSPLGRPMNKTNRNGQVTEYSFDALGRPVSTTVGSGEDLDIVQYTYTKTGQIRTEQTNNQLTVYTYDELGRVVHISEAEQNTLSDTSILNPDPEPEPEPEPEPGIGSTFTITLNANGGSGTPTTIQVTVGEFYDLPKPVRRGYTFSGWYWGSTKIVNGAPILITQDCTFIAHWIAQPGSDSGGGQPPPNQGGPGGNTGGSGGNTGGSSGGSGGNTGGQTQPGTGNRPGTGGTLPPPTPDPNPQSVEDEITAVGQTTLSTSASPSSADIPESDAGPTDELIAYTKTYSYDLAGNRTGFTLVKSGETVQSVAYTYDNLNRLSTVSEAGTLQATYTYDTNGNRASLTYANGTVETYSYNKANWITSLTNRRGSTILSSFSYTYYASGSQKSETDQTGKVTSYTYDGLGRLTSESETGGVTVNYTYDAAGNRAQMAVTGTENYATVYTYDANNRLLTEVKTESGATVTTTYTYDPNGNTLTKSTPAHGEEAATSTVYAYNGFNQLVGLNIDGTGVAYAYNAQGIRTAKRVNNLRTAFLLDGGNVVAEVQNNTVTDNYLRGINLIRRESTSETEYYLFNAHGDVVTTTNLNGTLNQSYDYDAFGVEKAPDALDTNPFRYCGEYLDFETGSYYLRARYYEPTLGRFTQQDTHWNTANMIYGDNPQKINERADKLGLKTYSYAPQIMEIMQSGNLYLYGINNPVAYYDQNGYFLGIILGVFLGVEVTVELVCAIVGITIGAIALFKITQEAIDLLVEYLNVTTERAEWLIEQAKGSSKSTEAQDKPEDSAAPKYKEPVSGKSGKEAANDVPSWAKGERPYEGESGKDFATRLMDEKYGKGNYDTGPGSEYNKIKKWGDRGFK